MTNAEHNLTVDDLIVEYMISKVENGYDPQFLTSEFRDFLNIFKSQIPVADVLEDNTKLFRRFFERKSVRDWYETIDWNTKEGKVTPHMDMILSQKDNDYIIKANYKLSSYDTSVINTYFMEKQIVENIRNLINEYLENLPKRQLNEEVDIDNERLLTSKYITVEIIKYIWNNHINCLIELQRWPKQCKDINKYLFEFDLAEIIDTKSMKKTLLEFYQEISKRIAILYQEDDNLIIANNGAYLAKSNYDLISKDYQNIFNLAFGPYKSDLNIDLAKSTFVESHEMDGFYGWYDDPDVKVTTKTIGNKDAKKLTRTFDNHIKY